MLITNKEYRKLLYKQKVYYEIVERVYVSCATQEQLKTAKRYSDLTKKKCETELMKISILRLDHIHYHCPLNKKPKGEHYESS